MGNVLGSASSLVFGKQDTSADKSTTSESKSVDDSHMSSVEAISEKLSEVTNLAEQLDEALCNAQVDGASSAGATVTPNIKKILDGTASTTPEEWYSNLRPAQQKTPNTSSDSKSEDEFVTASECTCTPPSRSSSFQTASEGGAISPWWEIDPTSDSDEKTKTETPETVKKSSPLRINSEMPTEVVVREVTETTSLKVSSSGSLGVTSFLLENSSCLLRPDMSPSEIADRRTAPEPSNATEIVRHLSEIVKNNESYVPVLEEQKYAEASKSEYRYDGDTSSQYSSELLNADFSAVPSAQNHSKSLSYETDNTDMSLPKFSAEIPPALPRFDKTERPRPKSQLQRTESDETSKIYIIDASTPSPKSKRYMETCFDDLELRKTVEAEVHRQEEAPRKVSDLNHNELEERIKEVRHRRRPVTTIDLQGACALPDYYYQTQLTKMAIKGIF
ncbi:UNVERIFIED_CONTAM: hypothetical protein PYX00_001381 [Menopon gallinae]|uniref:Uncharacterized protein n=1 Tax=Menopon gallinae TaxID=328185 RepID=A0AAW2ID98_9NEOP